MKKRSLRLHLLTLILYKNKSHPILNVQLVRHLSADFSTPNIINRIFNWRNFFLKSFVQRCCFTLILFHFQSHNKTNLSGTECKGETITDWLFKSIRNNRWIVLKIGCGYCCRKRHFKRLPIYIHQHRRSFTIRVTDKMNFTNRDSIRQIEGTLRTF